MNVIIERPGVRALPESALSYAGDSVYYWTYVNGHAVRTEVQTGVSDGEWIEVTNRHVLPSEGEFDDSWIPIDGTEQVILGAPKLLVDGAAVQVAPEKEGAKP